MGGVTSRGWVFRVLVAVSLATSLCFIGGADCQAQDSAGSRLDAPFADAALERARKAMLAGDSARGFRLAQRRVRAVRAATIAAFSDKRIGPAVGTGKVRGVIERYLGGDTPLLVVRHERFYFDASVYRLLAEGALRTRRPAQLAEAVCELIASRQATDADVAWARTASASAGADPRLAACIEEQVQ